MKKIKISKTLFKIYFLSSLCMLVLPMAIYAQGVEIPSGTGLPQGSDLKTVVENFMKWLLTIFGFLAIIAFIISGIMYLTSGGDKERAESAKRAMTYSIIGVIVGLAGYVIVQAIESMLKGGSNF